MSSLPPRPNGPESIPKQVNRFARRDPQLYPLAAVVLVTIGVAGYFLTNRPTGADTGHVGPSMPSRLKDEVDKQRSEMKEKK